MSQALLQEFIDQSLYFLNENTPRIKNCLDRLTEDQVWQRPNASSNSIGNLIIHLNGNITQYILSSLGGEEDLRERDLEFSAKEGWNKNELFDLISGTINQATEVIQKLSEEDLLTSRSVQGFDYTGVANIIHVVEHYSYHTGQIAYWTKLLKDEDLEFYDGKDLNKRNEF